MEDLCSICFCRDRKLCCITDTVMSHVYGQILNEIGVYNIYMNVQICWECKAVLKKFTNFKQQVKTSYVQLAQCINDADETRVLFLSQVSRLKIDNVLQASYPDIKVEFDALSNDVDFNNGTAESYDFVKVDDDDMMEEKDHCDYDETVKVEECKPESSADALAGGNVKVKKKKEKKIVEKKPTKQKKKAKTKAKLKNKKHVKTKKNNRKLNAILSDDSCHDFDEGDGERAKETEDEEKDSDKEDLDSKYTVYQEIVCDELTIKKVLPKPNGIKPKVVKKVKETSASGKPECAECGKVFSSKKTLRYHLNVLHKGNNRYPCPRCGKVYQWKSNLGRHIRSHKARDTGELYCETCDKRFASVATYRQHLSISKQHVTENEFSHICSECGKKFVSKTRLRDHVDWEHLQKIKFKCQLCNKPFKCHTSLYVHMKNVHRNKGMKDNLCHVCGKSYQNLAKLRYHIVAMHTGETPYRCAQCGAAFGWYSSLYRHMREVHYKMKVHPPKSKKPKKSLPPMGPPPHIVLPPMPPVGPPGSLMGALNRS